MTRDSARDPQQGRSILDIWLWVAAQAIAGPNGSPELLCGARFAANMRLLHLARSYD